jgi:hypothetical protein
MASLTNQYDPDAGVPGDFEIFEAGVYPLELVESDIKPTNAGTGKLFTYKIRITNGELEDRLIFGQLNLQNPNAIATKIGQEEFRVIREVTGVLEPDDTTDLHFREFQGVVKVTSAKLKKDKPANSTNEDDYYPPKNEVDWGKTYKLFASGEAPAEPKVAANDNAEKQKPAPAETVAPAPGAAPKKAAWPRKPSK